ncbi:MAG: serine hydrolase [Candidatus Pacebacteria bacterium]|nr:serine hydrolase [Candidatus Paceibacterota bacterium]MDD4073971.1 serine hydrolase [Candidatus Paceibacterota bacterium]
MKKKLLILLIIILCSVFFLTDCNSFNVEFQNKSVDSVDLFRPLSKEKINEINLESNNFISVFIKDEKEVILSEKEINEQIAIASLTKLMTAVIVLDNYNLEDLISISDFAIDTYGTAGSLQTGELISIKDLLYITLIESSNDGAEALAEKMGRSTFIYKMNEKARNLEMKNTRFINPTGLDEESLTNFSTANDLKKLVVLILNDYPLISKILSLPEAEITSYSGIYRKINNTNVLLRESEVYLWGKTGYTQKANGCLILILNNFSLNNDEGYVINIIAGANDRFNEARKLEKWLEESFIW